MAKNIINEYDPNFLSRSEIFADLALLIAAKKWTDWPKIEQFMELLPPDTHNAAGHKIDMHHQYQDLPFPEMGYEERIYKTGIISTREQNWHDFFNVFIWCLFPTTKILLNQLHMQELAEQQGKQRTPARDAITHLDESGVIVVATDEQVFKELKSHQWQEVFVQRRSQWWQNIACFVFGHGLYEKALNPFIGFTGKAYCIQATENFFARPKLSQYQQLDKMLSQHIEENKSLSDARQLSPLPVLGVPQWCEENQLETFYANRNYFRPLPQSKK